MTDRESTVYIPGIAVAHLKNGLITKVVFQPHGSDAGYFGPSAVLFEGDPCLDLEDTDGKFWKAIQKRLADDPTIGWEE